MIALDDAKGFDFHCHVDLDRDPVALIRRCEAERIVALAVTTTPKAWAQNLKWTEGNRFVISALGLHPELVAERHRELPLLESLMPDTRFVGEIGLDGSTKYRAGLSLQQQVFGRILHRANALGGRVCTIHSRWAVPEVLEGIERNTQRDRVLCILHWFTGSVSMARSAAELGCWFSVNGQMLQREASRKLVMSMPMDRLLTETDSPFSKEGDRASLPWDSLRTVDALARLYGLAPEKMRGTLTLNARRVLAFGGIRPTDQG